MENSTRTQCQFCAEIIYTEADICKHCGQEQRDANLLKRELLLYLILFSGLICIVNIVSLELGALFNQEKVSSIKKIGYALLSFSPVLIFLFAFANVKGESGTLYLVQIHRLGKRLLFWTAGVLFLVGLLFIGFVFSFYISPPPPMTKFKPFIQEERLETVQVLSEDDFDIATIHSVYNEDDGLRLYLGAWNSYYCVYRKSAKKIQQERMDEWWDEIHKETFSNIK